MKNNSQLTTKITSKLLSILCLNLNVLLFSTSVIYPVQATTETNNFYQNNQHSKLKLNHQYLAKEIHDNYHIQTQTSQENIDSSQIQKLQLETKNIIISNSNLPISRGRGIILQQQLKELIGRVESANLVALTRNTKDKNKEIPYWRRLNQKKITPSTTPT